MTNASYAASGVDVEAGELAVSLMRSAIRQTNRAEVVGDFGGFADDARLEGGTLSLSDRPGVGFEGQANLYRIMRTLLD